MTQSLPQANAEPTRGALADGQLRRAGRRMIGMVAPVLAAALSAQAADGPRVLGWLEPVVIENTGLAVIAKVDTGADYSSLDARRIRAFERRGEPWVSFRVVTDDGRSLELERRIHRYTTIRRAGGDEQRRPTVILGLCLGTVYREVQVNLVDRSRLRYRMLIGRDFPQGRYVVDPARTYVTIPACAKTKARLPEPPAASRASREPGRLARPQPQPVASWRSLSQAVSVRSQTAGAPAASGG